jgi:DsbC/DsbD-like thiol-disulfide interchange protein
VPHKAKRWNPMAPRRCLHDGLMRCFFTPACDKGEVMRLILALLLLVVVSPALAGETPWAEVAPGVQMRLVSTGEIESDGRTMVAIEIDMPESTKTYWQVPGDTGLPLDVELGGSRDVAHHQVLWPFPAVEQTPDYLDYVYRGHTTIPMLLAVDGEAPYLEAKLVLGICSEICIPAQAQFSLPLRDAAPDRASGLRIRQALADVPMAWPEDRPGFGETRLAPELGAVVVTVNTPDLDTHALIASFEDGVPLLGVPQIGPEANVVHIPVLDTGDMDELVGREVRLTFMTSEGAFETSRTIQPPG